MASRLTPAQYRAVWDALESIDHLPAADRRRELERRFASEPTCLQEAFALLQADEALAGGSAIPPAPAPWAAGTIEGSTLRAGPKPSTPAAPFTPVPAPPALRQRVSSGRGRGLGLVLSIVAALTIGAAAMVLVWRARQAQAESARVAGSRLGAVVAMAAAASGAATDRPVGLVTIEALHRSAGDDPTALLAAADAYARLSTSVQDGRDGRRWAVVSARNAVNLLEYVDGRGGSPPAVVERLADAQLLLAEQQHRYGDTSAAARALAAVEATIARLPIDRRSDRAARAAAQRRRLPRR